MFGRFLLSFLRYRAALSFSATLSGRVIEKEIVMNPARRSIRLLQSGRVTIEKRYLKSGLWGLCDHEDGILFIGKHLCETSQVKALIHESLHFLNPSKSERWVRSQERTVFDGLLHAEFLELVRILRRLK